MTGEIEEEIEEVTIDMIAVTIGPDDHQVFNFFCINRWPNKILITPLS